MPLTDVTLGATERQELVANLFSQNHQTNQHQPVDPADGCSCDRGSGLPDLTFPHFYDQRKHRLECW
jgi:hypothetical protein